MSETAQENPSTMSEVLKETDPADCETKNKVPNGVIKSEEKDRIKMSDTLQEIVNASISAVVNDQVSQKIQARRSNGNSEYSFYLELSAVNLDAILEVLTLMDARSLGRIDVHEKGLDITLCRPHMMCYAAIEASHVSKFQFRSPLEYKLINLRSVLHKLYEIDNDEDDDTQLNRIAIHHDLGSNQLSFKFGDEHSESTGEEDFSVEIYQGDPIHRRCPKHSFICKVVMFSEDFSQLIPLMVKQEKPQKVNVNIMDDNVIFRIGEMIWPYICKQKACGAERLKPGQSVSAEFWFPYTEALMSATLLSDTFLFCIVNDQHNTVEFRFDIEGFGHLAFVTLNSKEEPKRGHHKGITTLLRPKKWVNPAEAQGLTLP